MSNYNPLPDSPDSPTDVDVDIELDAQVDGYYTNTDSLSPLDPHPMSRGLNRETAGHDFFSAVYLDSPLHPAEKEELEEAMFGGTRPLRVKKKVVPGTRIAGVGPAARHRPSNVSSVPQSPRSPTSSRGHDCAPAPATMSAPAPAAPVAPVALSIARSDTITSTSTTSTLHPNHSISRIFLEGSPIPTSPPPEIPTRPQLLEAAIIAEPRPGPDARAAAYSALSLGSAAGPSRPPRPLRSPASRSGKLSIHSDLHLNLGNVHAYDAHGQPGPSPPSSVASSPTRRMHSFDTSQPLPPLPAAYTRACPPSPLTPSRAPAKAAKLLGATVGPGLATTFVSPRHGKKKDHFRPLPTQTLVEIERFFGSVPPKPSKKTLKKAPGDHNANAKLAKKAHISGPVHLGGNGLGDRNVGQGGTVRHTAEDGSMWMDVEEEQEFAWLMSDTYTYAHRPAPLPIARAVPKPVSRTATTLRDSASGSDTDAAWGMEAFTSVLSLPKGKKGKSGTGKAVHNFGESFFDFGDDSDGGNDSPSKLSKPIKSAKAPKKPLRLAVPGRTIPWSSSTESLQVVTPTKPTSDPASRIRTASPWSSPESDDGVYGTSPPRAASPPRLKNRPPPLRLAPAVKNPRLPVISTTPGSSTVHRHAHAQGQAQVHIQGQAQGQERERERKQPPARPQGTSSLKADATTTATAIALTAAPAPAPVTPFVRPRRAPVPGSSGVGAAPPQTSEALPTIPYSRPQNTTANQGRGLSIAIPQLPAMPMSTQPLGSQGCLPVLGQRSDGKYDEEPMEISYFELDSPTEEKPPTAHRRHVGGGAGAKSQAQAQVHGQGHGQGHEDRFAHGARAGWLKKVVRPLGGGGTRI